MSTTQPTETEAETNRTETSTPSTIGRPKGHGAMTDAELNAEFDKTESMLKTQFQAGDDRGVELQRLYLELLVIEAQSRADFERTDSEVDQ